MILVDTSIWIDHLRSGDARLSSLLAANIVAIHPFVLGEIALGYLRQRQAIMGFLQGLPRHAMATDAEVLTFIDRFTLAGTGIGYIDAHLLASTRLNVGSRLWTRDKRLAAVADQLKLAYRT